jgi:ribokinase
MADTARYSGIPLASGKGRYVFRFALNKELPQQKPQISMKKNITVIGSTNVDFLIRSDRLPVLGETVTDGVFLQNFGGKGANQALGAARAGGQVTFITCLGTDDYGDTMIRNFNADGIDTRFMFRDDHEKTGAALVMLDKSGNNYLMVAPGANYKLTPAHIDQAMDALLASEVIVLQMEIPWETNEYIFNLAKKHRKKILFNLAPIRPFKPEVFRDTYILVVNETEAAGITGKPVETDQQISNAAKELLAMGPKIVILTLGARGALVADGSREFLLPAFKVESIDTTAAGDVFCGSLAVALAEGKEIDEAVKFASSASAITVTRLGAQTSVPYREEIEGFLKG